jgi:hypothetical protein
LLAIHKQIGFNPFGQPASHFQLQFSGKRLSGSLVRTFKLVDDEKIRENNLQSLNR